MMQGNRCIGCMEKLNAGTTVCPHCGFDESRYESPPMALPPGSTLANGKYLVGRSLGQGGFGVTYLALDNFLELRVAIKEYLPRNMAFRYGDSNSLHWHSTVTDKQSGRESFLKEAKKMARIDEIPNVVRVKEVFYENDTAYIVMDYVEGETLLQYLKRTGPLSGADCLSLLRPVMKALSEAHSQGLIHRDISPDNIMLDKRNRVWLLDLGAAKEMDMEIPGPGGHTSTVAVIKDGFSPLEQYAVNTPGQSGGKKDFGPWTDVYAMAATIFYCMSGSMLPPAPNRVLNPRLELPGIIPPDIATVLVKGLALLPQDRIQTMDALWSGLEAALYGTEQADDVRRQGEEWKRQKEAALKREEEERRYQEEERQKEEARLASAKKKEEYQLKIKEARERTRARKYAEEAAQTVQTPVDVQKKMLCNYLQINLWTAILICGGLSAVLFLIFLNTGELYFIALPLGVIALIAMLYAQLASYYNVPALINQIESEGELLSLYHDYESPKYGVKINGAVRLGEKYLLAKGKSVSGLIPYSQARQVYIDIQLKGKKEKGRSLVIVSGKSKRAVIMYKRGDVPDKEVEGIITLLKSKSPNIRLGK